MRLAAALVVLGALAGCGGSASSPVSPATPTPAPTPTPEPAGAVRFLGATLPEGSTVGVAPMFATGQQAPTLAFRGAITLRRDLPGALVRSWVRTASQRCMGGGRAGVDFQAGVERPVETASMSHPGTGSPVCALPYATTHVEFEVLDTAGQQVLSQSFPVEYRFVAAP